MPSSRRDLRVVVLEDMLICWTVHEVEILVKRTVVSGCLNRLDRSLIALRTSCSPVGSWTVRGAGTLTLPSALSCTLAVG